jgi:two-component system, NtrC family, sensor kinase
MKIRSKLILAVGLISLAIVGILSSLVIGAQRRNQIQQEAEYARGLAETIRSSTRYAMLQNRREDVEQIIRTVGQQEEISDVRIFNKEGRIVYSGDPAALGTVVPKDAAACIECHQGRSPVERLSGEGGLRFYRDSLERPVLGVIRPIYNERSCVEAGCHAHPVSQSVLGVLDVSMPLSGLERQLAASRRSALLLAAAAVVVTSATIWLFVHFLVARPVDELLAATRTVAGGDLGHRLRVRRDDELGQLGQAFNDMTARLAQTQSQLYQSDRLASVGRLAAGVAHEINNPLTGVLTHSSLLLRGAADGTELKHDLEVIVRETKRCREIVNGLLDFSRQVPAHSARADLRAIIEHALEVVEHQLSASNIEATTLFDDDLSGVRVDSGQMIQVLVNLLINAADAIGPGGGEIVVSARLEDGDGRRWAVVKVADTGCGISPEDQEKIFEPFFTTKGPNKGTGLGLSQAYGFARQSGGAITAKSELGSGTSVTIHLPRSWAPPAPAIANEPPANVSGRGETILVVEDNAEVKKVAVSLLELLNYKTIAVESAKAALDTLAGRSRVDLVFTDVMLPGDDDGLALAKTVRTLHPGVPVLLASGYAKALIGRHGWPILRKPYQMFALAEAVRRTLDSHADSDFATAIL